MKPKMKRFTILLISFSLLLFSMNFVNSESYLPHKQNTDLEFSIGSNFATECILETINSPHGVNTINLQGTKIDRSFKFRIDSSNYSSLGTYCHIISCSDGVNSVTNDECREITATGKLVEGVGQISTGIIYFFLILGFGIIALGFALMKSDSVFIKYTGLIMMFIGGAFLYYDLHLTNLYATTIAETSGAGNVTTGAFLLVIRFIKLAPYLVAGIIAFASVKLLKQALANKRTSDGWDYGNY